MDQEKIIENLEDIIYWDELTDPMKSQKIRDAVLLINNLSEENNKLKQKLAVVTSEKRAAIKELDRVASCVNELSDLIDSELHPVVDYNLYLLMRENVDAISIWEHEKEWCGKGE